MYKIAVVGDNDSISGFAALGLSVYAVSDPENASKTVLSLAGGGYGIIYITEETAAQIPETIEKYRFVSIPAIILIPGIKGNTGAGMSDVIRSVEKAVGSNILK